MSRIADAFYGDTPAPYPKSPGFKERTTSRDAAVKFRTHAEGLRMAVLDVIEKAANGLTADEVAAELKQTVLAVRPRVSELYNLGAIERVPGLRRKNASGMSAAVWRKKA